MSDALESIRKFGPAALIVAGALAIVVLAMSLFEKLNDYAGPVKGASLPLIAVGAVAVLVLLLTALTMIFRVLGLSNKDQAMGLPEGSIRAVIALSLIVLFTVLSIFLYKSIKGDGDDFNTVARLPDAERQQFIKDHAAARDIQSELSKDAKGNLIKSSDGKDLYDVKYRSVSSPASDDFAKQLLVLLGTLMTAVTSFYLGANTLNSGIATGQATTKPDVPTPTLTDINPKTHSIATDGQVLHLEIAGTNLNIVTRAKIVRGSVEVPASTLHSNPTSVKCEFPVSDATTPPGDAWDVVVDDGGSKSAILRGTLTITA